MNTITRRTLVAALAATPVTLADARAQPGPLRPDQAFERLKSLVGDWQGMREDGGRVLINFRLTAADSVLVETWTMSPTRSSMTVYHMDGPNLVATHYCPLGNQPRLQYEQAQSNEVLHFAVRTVSNQNEAGHLRDFSTSFQADGAVRRRETYVYAARPETERLMLTRLPLPTANP